MPVNSGSFEDVLWRATVFAETAPRHSGARLTLKLSLTPETLSTGYLKRTCTRNVPIEI
jgi:hypothetical protein